MAEKILTPLDGSELAERVLTPVRALLDAGGRELVLLRVFPQASEPPAQLEEELDRAEQHLAGWVERLVAEGYDASYRLRRGDPAEQILALAEELQPELVAMATHGRSGVSRLVRGSVAERVLRHCPAPLLLTNPHTLASDGAARPPFQRILVPLDGSEMSHRILPLVERIAASYDSEAVLLRVEPYIYSAVPSPVLQEQWDPAAIARTLEPQKQRLERAGIPTRVEASYGIEAAEILRAAERADLVAMTTHGRSGLSRWWFGSVAEQVLRHCARPLLVHRVGEGGAR